MKIYTFQADGPTLLTEEQLLVPGGPRIGWADAFPVVGYWKIGDLIINGRQNAAIKSWACVEEGNPGVWEAGSSGGTSASLASDVLYDKSASIWVSNNVQDVLDEISNRVTLANQIPAPLIAGGLVQADGASIRTPFGGLTVSSGGPGIYNLGWTADPNAVGYIIQTSAKNTARYNVTIGNHTPNTPFANIKTYDSANAPSDTEFFVTIFAVKP